MNVVDRKIAPVSHLIETVNLLKPNYLKLPNDIPVYSIKGGNEEVIKIEFLFDAGNSVGNTAFVANACNNLLTAGTTNRTSAQIVETFDFYGAFFSHEINYDKASVSLYTLKKHLKQTLSVVQEILLDSVFPEKEVKTFAENTKQRLEINLQKNDFVARREFIKSLFGINHWYGRVVEPFDCEKITHQDIIPFFKTYYAINQSTIIISGQVDDEVLALVKDLFGQVKTGVKKTDFHFPKIDQLPKKEVIVRPDSLQSAIRIGKCLVNKVHPDYIDLQILITVLGGYFGSRLMANIREDKGYTYGIGASLLSMQHAGVFSIATEVGANVREAAVKEIYHEINRLQKELISKEEIDLVRNYIMGTFLGSIDNVFAHADKFKSIYNYGLDYTYFEKYIHQVKNINAERLLELAQIYLDPTTFSEVIVGK